MVAAGVSVGTTLLSLFLSLWAWAMTIDQMLRNGARTQFLQDLAPDAGARLYAAVAATHPDIAWALLLCAAIFLYLSLAPGSRRSGIRPSGIASGRRDARL
jgi:hypothetical protein